MSLAPPKHSRADRGRKQGPATRTPLLIGVHCSTGGGPHNAFSEARRLHATTMQVFTRNNMTWNVKPLTDEAIAKWHDAKAAGDIAPIVAHDSYLINLAAPEEAVYGKSRAALADELARCAALDIPYLVMHPGSPKGRDPDWGIERIGRTVRELLDDRAEDSPRLLFESTAGQGAQLGRTFEELAALLDTVDRPDRTGICLDTCHLFAAGYDISTPAGWHTAMDECDRVIGLDRVHCIHVNDAKRPLDSRVDRHEHIGQGHMGLAGFRALMKDARFRAVPKILETPKKGPNDEEMDVVNLNVLRRCAGRKVRS